MLMQPKLALCANRNTQPKINANIGEPLEWLSFNVLNSFGYSQLSFDFFINWNTWTCQDSILIKRILSEDTTINQLANNGNHFLTQQAINVGDNLNLINSFSKKYGFNPSYIVFRDVNWSINPEPILIGAVKDNGIEDIKLYSLNLVMNAIRHNSGGSVSMGSKGLTYGTSSLECYLSTTDALWPGDVDMILWNNTLNQAAAIIELKKHTLNTAISDQQLSNYYPQADGRKYDRLALLRDRLGYNIPIINLYYPTRNIHSQIKLELIDGNPQQLKTKTSNLIDFSGLTKAQIGVAIMTKINEILSNLNTA